MVNNPPFTIAYSLNSPSFPFNPENPGSIAHSLPSVQECDATMLNSYSSPWLIIVLSFTCCTLKKSLAIANAIGD